jgi:chromosome segregation ATPase
MAKSAPYGDAKKLEEAQRHVDFLERQRAEELGVVKDAAERDANLRAWIADEERKLADLRAELAGLPARVVLARSRMSGINEHLTNARAALREIQRRVVVKRQLERAKEELVALNARGGGDR